MVDKIFYIGCLVMCLWLGAMWHRLSGPQIVWAVRYSIRSGDCTFIKNSADEGYYYKTEEQALQNGQDAIQSDTSLGYKYIGGLEAFPTINPD